MKNISTKTLINKKYTEKLSRNATFFSSLFLAPTIVHSAVIHNTSSLTISINDARSSPPIIIDEPYHGGTRSTFVSSVDWDVDGNSIVDFNLNVKAYTFRNLDFFSNPDFVGKQGQILLKSNRSNRSNRQSIIGQSSLTTNITVGPTLTSNLQWEKLSGQVSVGTYYNTVTFISPSFNDLYLENPIKNYIGFSFIGDTDEILYAWAQVSVDSVALSLTIEQWGYEDNGGSIKIGQISSVPLPSSMLLTLSGLALGAGGVLRRRKAKKEALK